jgi:nitrite reductase/ring-hydroxylating ferredoxin subunit
MNGFVTVMKTSELPPGQMRLVLVKGMEIVVANVGGGFRAFGNLCPHEEGPLCEGELDGDTVVCPWHYSRFDTLTGEVIDGVADAPIRTYEVRVSGENVDVRVS